MVDENMEFIEPNETAKVFSLSKLRGNTVSFLICVRSLNRWRKFPARARILPTRPMNGRRAAFEVSGVQRFSRFRRRRGIELPSWMVAFTRFRVTRPPLVGEPLIIIGDSLGGRVRCVGWPSWFTRTKRRNWFRKWSIGILESGGGRCLAYK